MPGVDVAAGECVILFIHPDTGRINLIHFEGMWQCVEKNASLSLCTHTVNVWIYILLFSYKNSPPPWACYFDDKRPGDSLQ